MAKAAEFDATFARLRRLLEPFEKDLVVASDTGENYSLDVAHTMANRKPLFFGAVRRMKSYVSFYLMPVYVHPELLENISSELRARMQGKSCFNFRTINEAEADELARLTAAGMDAYRADGYL